MTSFITIAVLICQVGASNRLQCYDKGAENLRDNEVKTSVAFQYYKCSDNIYRVCDLDTKWDGCKFTMTDKKVVYSSYTCP
jgi:hypothetical protein